MIITGFICVALTAGTSTSTFSPWNRLRILPRPPNHVQYDCLWRIIS